MEFSGTGTGAGSLDIGDDFWWGGERIFLGECAGAGGDSNFAVGFRKESGELCRLLRGGCECLALDGAFGAGVAGGGNGCWAGS